MREHTPTADAPVQQPQHTAPQIHENVKAVSTETTPSLTERSVREAVSPVKEKPVPPINIPQPKMREYAPNADVPVHRPQHPDSRIHEGPQPVHQPQTNRSVRELETSVREKPAGKARPAEQRSLGQSPASTEPSAPATTPTVQPSARTLAREKRLFRLCMNSLSHPKRIPHSSRFLQSRRKSTSERSGKSRIFSKKNQAVLKTQLQIPKLFRRSSVHGKLFVNSKNSTFPIVRSRSSQPCRRSEHGSRRRPPCAPIRNP